MSLVDLGKRLLEAAKQGFTDEVRSLMSNGAPFTTDWLGTSPLHYASLHGHVSTAEVLLRAGISRDARTKVDRTPLHAASQEGHPDVVDLLIKNGADIEAKDMLKMTPLHWAVEKGHVGVIELLLGHGSDINTDNKFDMSPVDIAIHNGRADLAELLQLSRMPQQNIVEVTTDQTVVEEVTDTDHLELQEVLEDDPQMVISGSPINVMPSTSHARGMKVGRNELSGVTSVDGTEQSSTAVLATLAALAEATGPLNSNSTTNTTAAEALSWLESHGITMISGDSPTSLVDSGNQSLSLTEAGKLALDFVKQKVITVATDDGELTDESGTPMVIHLTSTGEAVAEPLGEQDGPLMKGIKLEQEGEVIASMDGRTITSLPPGYVLAKTEPDESQEDYLETETVVDSIQEHITTETVDGHHLMISGDNIIVSEEGVVEQDGMGITIHNDIVQEGVETDCEIAQHDDIAVQEMHCFEVQETAEETELQEQTLESSESHDFQNRLDDITSKT